MQLTLSKEVQDPGGVGNSVSCTRLLQSKYKAINMVIPVPTASSSFMPSNSHVQTKLKLPGFGLYMATKENERRSFNVRAKDKKRRRIVEEQPVVILVGILGENKKPKRCETLPVSVLPSATPAAVVEAAVAKQNAFNKRFNGNLNYRLVFRDGSQAISIPGTNPPEPFTLMRYKEASGFGSSKITFFLRVRDVVADLEEAIESDSNSDEEMGEDDNESFTTSASRPAFGQNQMSENQNDESSSHNEKQNLKESEVSMMVNCSTCGENYSVLEIEEHADLCADYVVELPDPIPLAYDKMAAQFA